MKILVLGVSGMLGSTVYKTFSESLEHQVWGSIRGNSARAYFSESQNTNIIDSVDVLDTDALLGLFSQVKPDVVINCVGLIKQMADANDPLITLPLNSLLPHRLSKLCSAAGARFVHISTDCVFSGSKGMYTESDSSDANDLYGKSKYIGEVVDDDNTITLRTSIIGHELSSTNSLIDWFLSQDGVIKGFTKAVFSGFPTAEIAKIIMEYVLPRPQFSGLYHLSAEPINKYDLLELVAAEYKKDIEITSDTDFVIDRSLNSERFRDDFCYQPPAWPELVKSMREFNCN